MNPMVIFTAAALLLFGGTPQQATTTAGWHTYTSPTQGFEFKYPNDWELSNTRTDRANITWINFARHSPGTSRNTLYVKVFPDQKLSANEERIIASNATLTPITIDGTPQHLYANVPDIPTAVISRGNLYLQIGDPSGEGHLRQILTTFRFVK